MTVGHGLAPSRHACSASSPSAVGIGRIARRRSSSASVCRSIRMPPACHIGHAIDTLTPGRAAPSDARCAANASMNALATA
ncbi:putative polyketide synthase [Burkholderia pseudomallei MSHR435]|nr:putative polyketide synthase [Burkholderia pseudomallei MSHR435]